MLGAKTTAKDRWRQVLEEADNQQDWLYTVEDFLIEVKERQIFADNYGNG